MTWLTRLLDRIAAWYWRDPIARKRHELGEQVAVMKRISHV